MKKSYNSYYRTAGFQRYPVKTKCSICKKEIILKNQDDALWHYEKGHKCRDCYLKPSWDDFYA